MHGPINVKSPNNITEWQMGFNSAFKGLMMPKCWIDYVNKHASLWHELSHVTDKHSLTALSLSVSNEK